MIDRLKRFNWLMFAAMLALVALGTAAIYSAGNARSEEVFHSMWKANLSTALFGLAIYFVLAFFDYRRYVSLFAAPAYLFSLVLLVAVLVFGAKVYGGRRWLWFFQPSEVSKLAVLLFVAHLFGRMGRESFRWFMAGLLVLGAPALLILAEPDLGTALVLVPAVLAMLLAARVWTKGLVTILLMGILAMGTVLGTVYVAEGKAEADQRARIYSYVPLREHQLKRLRVFLFPDRDITTTGYNLRQAQISIGSGSMWGKGLKKGEQKSLGYLPPSVSMNDFIFAVLAEESGFMGALTMLALFLGILLAGIRIAFMSGDDRGRLFVIGATTLVFCHLYINVAMSIGLMPITGLPLPFISAGRTFLVVLLAMLGIVQSVAVHQEED